MNIDHDLWGAYKLWLFGAHRHCWKASLKATQDVDFCLRELVLRCAFPQWHKSRRLLYAKRLRKPTRIDTYHTNAFEVICWVHLKSIIKLYNCSYVHLGWNGAWLIVRAEYIKLIPNVSKCRVQSYIRHYKTTSSDTKIDTTAPMSLQNRPCLVSHRCPFWGIYFGNVLSHAMPCLWPQAASRAPTDAARRAKRHRQSRRPARVQQR
jgi:hypothetical protein